MGARPPLLSARSLQGATCTPCMCARSPTATPPWTTSTAHRSPMPSWSNPTPRCQRLLPSLSLSRRNVPRTRRHRSLESSFCSSTASSTSRLVERSFDVRPANRFISRDFCLPLGSSPRRATPRRLHHARVNERNPVGRDTRWSAEIFTLAKHQVLSATAFRVRARCLFRFISPAAKAKATSSRGTQAGNATYGFVLSER